MLNYFDNLTLEIEGASHSEQIVTKVTGFPCGEDIDLEKLQEFTNRRRSVNSTLTTPRKEEDRLEFVSGFENSKISGDIEVAVKNLVNNSKDYEHLKNTPRPSHADYTAVKRYGAGVDLRGGGRFSGRLTLGHCIAGGIAKQLLEKEGIKVCAYIGEIAGIKGKSYRDGYTISDFETIEDKTFAVLGENKQAMIQAITQAREEGDSVGGIVDCIVDGLPAGIGGELMQGLEGKIAGIVYSIPAVKGVEFGAGFDISKMRGSQANDCFSYDEEGRVYTTTNNNGGINGGISNGMPITLRVAFKPTPSISKEQDSIDIKSKTNVKIKIAGRHDACIVPRAVVGVEGAVCLAIYDSLLTIKKERM